MRRGRWMAVAVLLGCWTASASAAGLQLREIVGTSISQEGPAIPADAVEVFTYEGEPTSLDATAGELVVRYPRSTLTFGRDDDRLVHRYTVADAGNPYAPEAERHRVRRRTPLVGPGVLQGIGGQDGGIAAEVKFAGQTWRARQPSGFLNNLGRDLSFTERRQQFGSWTPILRVLEEQSYLERIGNNARRYTKADGLAGNIVTQLLVANDSLWVVCADIYKPDAGQWDTGGLCRYDPEADRFERIDKIDGHPVHFVTLLQVVGNELWVGFREGHGLAGDAIAYGMGVYPGIYRPQTKAIVLARLKDEQWTSFSRPPRQDEPRRRFGGAAEPEPPTETPSYLVESGQQVFLFSTIASNEGGGNWDVPQDGVISLLDVQANRWRLFDALRDLGADDVRLLRASNGEILLGSNTGAYRWDVASQKFVYLDPHSILANPTISAITPVGEELWVGYTNQAFGILGRQGISRYDSKTGRWSYLSSRELGTNCPVRNICSTDGRTAWVLFRPRPWYGAAGEWNYYPREHQQPETPGLGRFADGRWEFPVKLEGVPETREVQWKDQEGRPRTSQIDLLIAQIATLDEKLYVANGAGIYQGPGKWRRVVDGNTQAMVPNKDGKSLLAIRQPTRDVGVEMRMELVRYEPTGDRVSVVPVPEAERMRVFTMQELEPADSEPFASTWTRISRAGEKDMAIGPLESDRHRVIRTAEAIWIVSTGQLIRLDLAKLGPMLRARP